MQSRNYSAAVFLEFKLALDDILLYIACLCMLDTLFAIGSLERSPHSIINTPMCLRSTDRQTNAPPNSSQTHPHRLLHRPHQQKEIERIMHTAHPSPFSLTLET